MVHGDVFRPPKKGMLLSVMLGCGTQIFIMVFFTLGEIDLMYFSMASKELYTFSFGLLGMFFSPLDEIPVLSKLPWQFASTHPEWGEA